MGSEGESREGEAISELARSLQQATPEEAMTVMSKMREHASQLREAGDVAQAMNLENLVGILEQVKKQQQKVADMEGTLNPEAATLVKAPPPVAPGPLKAWDPEREWESLKGSSAEEVFAEMSKRIEHVQADCDYKMSNLKTVCKDWMDKVKSDMQKTEDLHNQRLTQMQMVAQEWEAQAQAVNQQLSKELEQVKADKVELEQRVELYQSGAEGGDSSAAQLEGMVQALEGRMMQAAEESVHHELRAEQMAAEAKRWQEEVQDLTPRLEERTQQVQDMELTIEAYRKLCAEYTLRAEEAEAKLTQAQNAITTMDANFANEVAAAVAEQMNQ